MHALVVTGTDNKALPEGTAALLNDRGWYVDTVTDYDRAIKAAEVGTVDTLVVVAPQGNGSARQERIAYEHLMQVVAARNIATILIADTPETHTHEPMSLVDPVERGVSLAELRGRFAMIERYHEHFKRMQNEVRNMERLGKRLNQHFREVEQEMRLAGRLQRDFLPRINGPIGNVQFAATYRPATWVSGDIFDIFRVDDTHTGFYIADAVGHGMAAGLLTMFIKKAIVPHHAHDNGHTVLTPSEAISQLNRALTDQALPNCQFVTACYGLLNHETLRLSLARAGHPYPVHIAADGTITHLQAAGGLLGLSRDEEFPSTDVGLSPGDKVLLYTDGVELAFQNGDKDTINPTAYNEIFASLSCLPIVTMLRRLEAMLDAESGSLYPQDDVSFIGLEVLGEATPAPTQHHEPATVM